MKQLKQRQNEGTLVMRLMKRQYWWHNEPDKQEAIRVTNLSVQELSLIAIHTEMKVVQEAIHSWHFILFIFMV
jgi:hypothetical protein